MLMKKIKARLAMLVAIAIVSPTVMSPVQALGQVSTSIVESASSPSVIEAATIAAPPIQVESATAAVPHMGIIVNFDANGGTLLEGNTQRTTTTGNAVSGTLGVGNMPIAPNRAGFQFLHWNIQQDGLGSVFTYDTEVFATGEPLRVYAQWGLPIHFNGNGINLSLTDFPDILILEGRSAADTQGASLPAPPTRAGHSFVGWFDTSSTVGGLAFTENTIVNSPMRVYARWLVNPTLTVTFNPSGGTIAPGQSATRQTIQGLSINTSSWSPHNLNAGVTRFRQAPLATRAGLSVQGWYTQPNGGGTWFADPGPQPNTLSPTDPNDGMMSLPVQQNMTVYAHWMIRIHFYPGTGTSWSRNSRQHNRYIPMGTVNGTLFGSATDPTLPPEPIRPGHVFNGWRIGNTNGPIFTGNTIVNTSVYLHANWEELPQRPFVFDANGGTFPTGTTHTVLVREGERVSAATQVPAIPQRTGYTFMGWFAPGQSPILNTHSNRFQTGVLGTIITPSLTVVNAQWLPNNPVTFTAPSSSVIRYVPVGFSMQHMHNVWGMGSGIVTGPTGSNQEWAGWYNLNNRTPVIPGQAFRNWHIGSDTGDIFGNTTVVTGSYNLHASFMQSVIFHNNHGSVIPSATNHTRVMHVEPAQSLVATRAPLDPTGITQADGAIQRILRLAGSHLRWPSIDETLAPSTPEFQLPTLLPALFFGAAVLEAYQDGLLDDLETWPTAADEIYEYLHYRAYYHVTLDASNAPLFSVNMQWAQLALANYAFMGFNSQADGGGDWFTERTPIPPTVHNLFAIWGQGVAFHSGHGPDNAIEESNRFRYATPGQPLGSDFPPNPTAVGLNFSHWNQNRNGTGITIDGSIPINSAMTLFAIWTAGVTFDTNGGLFANGAVTVMPQITVGAPIGALLPTAPTRENHLFLGWNTESDGSGTNFTATGPMVTHNMTLYAQWQPILANQIFALQVDPNSHHTFPNLQVGYPTAPVAHSVTVTNVGNQPLTNTVIHLTGTEFILGGATPPAVFGVGESFIFTLQPQLGLPVGIFTDSIRVTADQVTPTATHGFDVSFEVTLDPQPTVTAVEVTPPVATIYVGETQAYTAVVTGTLNPPQDVTWQLFGHTAPDTTISPGGVVSVSLTETATTIIVRATSVFDNSVYGEALLHVTQLPADIYALSVTPHVNHTFPARQVGYTTPVPVHTVVVTNVGNQPLANAMVHLSGSDFILGGVTEAIVFGVGDSFTFTVQPEMGLSVGTFTDSVNVTADNVAPVASHGFSASFTVTAPSPSAPDPEPAPQPSAPEPTETPSSPEPEPRPVPVVITELVSEHRTPYILGFPNGSFEAEQSLTRAQIAVILFRLSTNPDKNEPLRATFSDISADAWYYQAVAYLSQAGIVQGFTDNSFRGLQPVTRAELSAMLARFVQMAIGAHPFNDVTGHWAQDYITSAYQMGWLLGYPDGSFRPNAPITRVETVTLMNRVTGRRARPETIREQVSHTIFTDHSPLHWGFYEIIKASVYHTFVINDQNEEIWLSAYQ